MSFKLRDLGTHDEPVLFFGGPYSNWQATRALFDQADRAGIPPERRICTGDVAAYCANPLETAREVMTRGGAVVAGNCERQLAAGELDCGCGFDDGSACDILSAGWYPFAQRALAGHGDVLAFFADCPDIAVLTHCGRRIAVIHGGLTDIARFLFSVTPVQTFAQEIALIQSACGPVDAVIAGHSGIGFIREIDGTTWANAGAIGMPAHNGKTSTEFLILEDGKPRIERLEYDHVAAARAMYDAGLNQGYERALETGYWPSEDVLPDQLRIFAQADDG